MTHNNGESSTSQLESIIIVGAGAFGLSTALELVSGKYKSRPDLITVLDRSATPPAADAASSDYNKDYCDPLWAKLASTAIKKWSTPEWSPYFAQSGCLVMSHESHPTASTYVRSAYEVQCDPSLASEGRQAISLPTPRDIKSVFNNDDLPLGAFEDSVAYINPLSGWAHARRAMDMMCEKIRQAGVRVMGGEVDRLVYGTKRGQRDVTGVKLVDGRTFSADKIVVASGAWSAKFAPEIGKELLASGQCVAHIQLTPEEAARYAKVPVVFRMDTGFYVFPPTPEGIVKFAIHGPGWINPTHHNDNFLPSVPLQDYHRIPREGVVALKLGLLDTYPELASKDWFETRMCWYCESPSSDWLLDYHPDHPSLFIAAGDSGHGFKFLPTLGSIITSALDRNLPDNVRNLFSWSNLLSAKGDPSRGGTASFDRKPLMPESKL